MNTRHFHSSRSILLALFLGWALSGCQSDSTTSTSENNDPPQASTASDTAKADSFRTTIGLSDSLPTDSQPVASLTPAEDQPSTETASTQTADARPPIPKPDDIDPTRILKEDFEKPDKPKPKPQPQSPELNQGGIAGCWTDSREEYQHDDGFKVFRPCTYKRFPASRFRYRMDLQADGSCTWLGLAPNDRHSMKPGTWHHDKATQTLRIKDAAGKAVHTYEVLEIRKDMLKVREK